MSCSLSRFPHFDILYPDQMICKYSILFSTRACIVGAGCLTVRHVRCGRCEESSKWMFALLLERTTTASKSPPLEQLHRWSMVVLLMREAHIVRRGRHLLPLPGHVPALSITCLPAHRARRPRRYGDPCARRSGGGTAGSLLHVSRGRHQNPPGSASGHS